LGDREEEKEDQRERLEKHCVRIPMEWFGWKKIRWKASTCFSVRSGFGMIGTSPGVLVV